MAHPSLEARVASLENQVTELQTTVANGQRAKDWRRTIGMFTGDEGMQQFFEDALKIREADRERARRRFGKKKRAKS
jgi:hypothetical protein